MTDIKDIVHELGRSLCGQIDHVVGVSLLRDAPGDDLSIYVDIDDESAREHVPKVFLGYTIYCRLVGTPQFL